MNAYLFKQVTEFKSSLNRFDAESRSDRRVLVILGNNA